MYLDIVISTEDCYKRSWLAGQSDSPPGRAGWGLGAEIDLKINMIHGDHLRATASAGFVKRP